MFELEACSRLTAQTVSNMKLRGAIRQQYYLAFIPGYGGIKNIACREHTSTWLVVLLQSAAQTLVIAQH